MVITGDKFILNTYEYMILEKVPDEKELNDLGCNGWELCGVQNNRIGVRFYFKRKNGELMNITRESTTLP